MEVQILTCLSSALHILFLHMIYILKVEKQDGRLSSFLLLYYFVLTHMTTYSYASTHVTGKYNGLLGFHLITFIDQVRIAE